MSCEREREITGIFFLVPWRSEEKFRIIRGRVNSGVDWESRLGLTWNNFQNNTRIRSHCKLWSICIVLLAWTDRASENGSSTLRHVHVSISRYFLAKTAIAIEIVDNRILDVDKIFLFSTLRTWPCCYLFNNNIKRRKSEKNSESFRTSLKLTNPRRWIKIRSKCEGKPGIEASDQDLNKWSVLPKTETQKPGDKKKDIGGRKDAKAWP